MDGAISIGVEGLLSCPVCGGQYLHHGKVTVYDRDQEDADGTVTTVRGEVTIRRAKSAAMPGRRDAVHIDFYCEEGCGATLSIMQHKGSTFLEWLSP